MNIEDREYLNVYINEFEEPDIATEDEIYSKQTLLHSPIFKQIVPNFRIAINKEFRGLTSDSFNDEADQYLGPKEEDSQIDVFSDDEDLFNIGEISSKPTKPDVDSTPLVFKEVSVIIKLTSILVEDAEFHLNSQVRSSCILRGSHEDLEDSLLIALKSGFLLLMRMFRVSIGKNESSDENSLHFVFKPFIVQWWDTSSDLSAPSLYSSGHSLRASSSGLSAVSTSSSNVFRIFNIQATKYGIALQKHHNVPVDGVILHSSFAMPLNNQIIDHSIFMALVFSNFNRLEINLFEWSISEGVNQTLKKSVLPLENTFKIPIFIVPLNIHGAFLFVKRDEITIITIHDIISANYDFISCPFEGSFPTNYYMPRTNIIKEDNTSDEIILSTDTGVLYSILIKKDNSINIRPILRLTDSISLFTLEREEDGYRLIFGSHTGSNREVLVPELYSDEYLDEVVPTQKLKYSPVLIITDYKNWSPVLDVQVIDSFKSRSISSVNSQEVWALSGCGKRTKLTQIRQGYIATKISKTYEKLRKAERIFPFSIDNRIYILCALPFESILLEYQPEEREKFAEIEDSALTSGFRTILLTTLLINGTEIIIHIAENCILLSTLTDTLFQQSFSNKKILASSNLLGDYFALVIENTSDKSVFIELFRITDNFEQDIGIQQESNILISQCIFDIGYEASYIKLIDFSTFYVLLVGSFEGKLLAYRFQNNTIQVYFEIRLAENNPYLRNTFFNLIIANDIIHARSNNTLFVGTKEGYLLQFSCDTNFNLTLENYIRIGDTPITFSNILNDPNSFLICSKCLYKVDMSLSFFPRRVYFEERFDRTISAMAQLPNSNNTFCFVREDGLSIALINSITKPNIKQVSIGEGAKRFIYLHHLSTFVILCDTKDQTKRFKLIDRKLLKLIKHSEFNLKLKTECVFEVSEYPLCACIWSIRRQNKISKKLLIGCSVNGIKGSFKVLDINKNTSIDDELRVTELTSFDHRQPITNILQVSNTIVFSSGQSIYATSYDLDEKRLKPIYNLISLPSDIISLSSHNEATLLITTKSDSIYHFELNTEEIEGNISERLRLVASDPLSKSLVNQVRFNKRIITGDKLHSTILFLDQNNFSIQNQLKLKMSSIPRVFICDFNKHWSDSYNLRDSNNSGVLSIGVNGEVVLIRSLSNNEREYAYLKKKLNLLKKFDLLTSYVNSLDMPFVGKVNGKGLISINKNYLDYKENKVQNAFIDYDIDELSDICWSEVYI